ncbi:MAG: hypothetical protein ACLTXR_00305 [Clostridia bacterium]
MKIMIISFIALLLYCTNSYGVESGTVRMQINGGTAWTNINISESYAECESLNSPTSTLGTSALKAHLTTDADWSAMAIFSVSQYGGATDNSPKTTTGNSSGIYNVGSNWTQTTGILSTANKNSTPYVSGLFNDDGSVKKIYKTMDFNKSRNKFCWFSGFICPRYLWLDGRKRKVGNFYIRSS